MSGYLIRGLDKLMLPLALVFLWRSKQYVVITSLRLLSGFRQLFEKLNVYFMKTANIPVYGNFAAYLKYLVVDLKIEFTLRCL